MQLDSTHVRKKAQSGCHEQETTPEARMMLFKQGFICLLVTLLVLLGWDQHQQHCHQRSAEVLQQHNSAPLPWHQWTQWSRQQLQQGPDSSPAAVSYQHVFRMLGSLWKSPATKPPAADAASAPPAAAVPAAAATDSDPGPGKGPVVKSVSEVKPGESCMCWTPDWCTCGWQSCPYKPPEQAVNLPTESARTLFESDCLPKLQLSADVQQARFVPPLTQSLLRRYNKRISTQLIDPIYQFTKEHYVLEGARQVVEAGGDSYKFNLQNADASKRPIQNVKTVLDMVRSPSLPYAEVFDLPLTNYFMWVFPNYSNAYQDTYEMAAYLLQRYQGTGKQFFIGMWEGDHALRNAGNWNAPPVVWRVEVLQNVIQQKQRAVDAAKRDFASCRNVYVWNYIEVNQVINSVWNRGTLSLINYLVPTIDDPPVDYISYSAYEVLFQRGDLKFQNLTAAFDYMAQRLPDKPNVPGPRVFLGEWAFPMFNPDGSKAWSLEESRLKGLYAAAVSIAWGSQFNQYWQLYSNQKLTNGTGDRGFWLIMPNRQAAPIWTNIKDYFAASDEFLRRFWACYGGWPSDYTYRVWAVKTLMKLVNKDTLPEPVVRELSATSYGRQVKLVADGMFGQFGSTITFRPSGSNPSTSAASSSSYVPISGDTTSSSIPATTNSASNGYTPPLVPQLLMGGGGDRGRCPVPLPMLRPGAPVPPSPSPKPGNASSTTAKPGNGTRPSYGTTAAAPTPGNGTRPGNGTAVSLSAQPDKASKKPDAAGPAPGQQSAGAAAAATPGKNGTTGPGGAAGAGAAAAAAGRLGPGLKPVNASNPANASKPVNTAKPANAPQQPTNAPKPANVSQTASASKPAANMPKPASSAGLLTFPGKPTVPTLLLGPAAGPGRQSGAKASAADAANAADVARSTCNSWSEAADRIKLSEEDCPIRYPRITVDDVASGKGKPYAYGGIDRIGCANCQQKGLWPKFCLWRRTESPGWDSINCNQRESFGRASVQKNVEFAVNMSRYWPASSGIPIPSGAAVQKLPPGPAEITPCDVFRLIRGRTLWIIGDSQMKGLYTALKCFMLEFWDLKQYAPTWNRTTIDYLNKLPRNAEAKCIHLPESTRICQLKVLWADVFVEKPSKGETRWTTPVLELLQSHMAAPEDIFAVNFGLWYDPKNPVRYYSNLVSLGQVFQATKAIFPNLFFLETVKLHWPDPAGDQDGPRTSNDTFMEQCTPTESVEFDPRTSELRKAEFRDATATPAAAAAAVSSMISGGVDTATYSSSSRSSGNRPDPAAAVYSISRSGSEGMDSAEAAQRLSANGAQRVPLSFASIQEQQQQKQQQEQQEHSHNMASRQRPSARAMLQSAPGLDPPADADAGQGADLATASSSSSSSGGNASGSKSSNKRGPQEDSPVFTALQPGSDFNKAPQAPAQQQQQQQQQQQDWVPVTTSASRAGSSLPSAPAADGISSLRLVPSQPGFGAGKPQQRGNTVQIVTIRGGQIRRTPTLIIAATTTPPPATATPPSTAAAAAAGTAAVNAAAGSAASSAPSSPAVAARVAAETEQAASAAAAAAVAAAATGFGTRNLPPELSVDAVLSGLWRNQVARSVLRDTYEVNWVPIYNATVPVWWGHRHSPDSPDCIHYCNPGVPQNWMAKLMLAIALKVPPLEREAADRRCLWGTEVVYDDGEKDFQ